MKNPDKNEVCVIFQSPEEEAQFSKIARDIMMHPEKHHKMDSTEEKPGKKGREKGQKNMGKANKNVAISVRINAESEKEFTKFCEKIGLTKSQAINIFIEKTIREQAIPFPVKLEGKDIIEKQAERISKLETALFTGNEDYIWEEDN